MKMEQLREHLEGLSPADLRLLAAELYRMLPKKVAEAKGADQLVLSPQEFVKPGRAKKASPLPDFEELLFETEGFLEDARQQKYFAPNRDVPKSERSKWRFVARRLYRDWCLLAAQPANLPPAIKALEDLYQLLCRANQVYLFPSSEPFRAMGVLEHEFFAQLFSLKYQTCAPGVWLAQALEFLKKDGWQSSTSAQMHAAFLSLLKTAELKEAALEAVTRSLRSSPQLTARESADAWNASRRRQQSLSLVFQIAWALGEPDRAQESVRAHAKDPEEGEQIVLRMLLATGDMKRWVEAYEEVRRRQPTVAQHWAKTLEHAQKHGQLPTRQVT
jgi:hypothetical protein